MRAGQRRSSPFRCVPGVARAAAAVRRLLLQPDVCAGHAQDARAAGHHRQQATRGEYQYRTVPRATRAGVLFIQQGENTHVQMYLSL